jgi:hypothetical protein
MVEDSVFRNVLLFFERLGIYDVVLPFLLTFTIFFAVLERTKVLGTEKVEGPEGGEQGTKKNLNAIVAFCGAFFVIASSKMVAIIHESLPNIILLILIMISYLLLIGTFHSEKEEVLLEGAWKKFMMGVMFIAVVLIFAHAIPASNGEPWLNYAYDYVVTNFDNTAVSAIVLTIIVIGLMMFITKDDSPKKDDNSKS